MPIIRPILSRRRLLQMGAGGLLLPRSLMASPAEIRQERKFLFILCNGGWDPTYVFSDSLNAAHVDTEPDAVLTQVGDLSFVDHPERPGVRQFFETWGDQCSIINGMEVQSITHDRCLRLIHTGMGDDSADDWGSQLASASVNDLLLPYVLINGFSYTSSLTSQVVRLGPTGQLKGLIMGTHITDKSDLPVSLPSLEAESLVHAHIQHRVDQFEAQAGPGRPSRWAPQHARVLEQLPQLADYTDLMDNSNDGSGDLPAWNSLSSAVRCLATGLSRCAMVKYDGRYSAGWDTHSDNAFQSFHFMDLFDHLEVLMETLSTETGLFGTPLLDEITVVVFSEMGRSPLLNSFQGKDHFTYTSAMLMGSGIRGGQVIGSTDDYGVGQPIDLASGGVSDQGEYLDAKHLGSTLLDLGEAPVPDELHNFPSITAAID